MFEFRFLVDLSSDAALAIGGDSKIVAWNARAAALLGYAPEQVLGRHCYDVLKATLPSGEPLCTPECEGKLCFSHHSPFAVHACSLRHRDGRWLQASISTLVPPALSDECADGATVAVAFLRPRHLVASAAAADRQLRIYTCGRFGLSVAGRSVPTDRWHRKHALTLLKLLVTNRGETMHREHVIECLWPDANERRGRERLKVTTCFLRQQLRAAGVPGDAIAVANETYALRRDAVWLDCEQFENFFREGWLLEQRGRLKEALVCFEKAASMYKGDYLPEERYADWCAEERERLREVYFDMLGHMADGYVECGDYERAADVCRCALAREPCRERFHRALMFCLARLGQYDRAIAHYRRCCEALKAELDVTPAPETERLYRELVAVGAAGSPASSAVR